MFLFQGLGFGSSFRVLGGWLGGWVGGVGGVGGVLGGVLGGVGGWRIELLPRWGF